MTKASQTARHRSRRQQGFTLVELMITVAIIGILSAIAMPAFMAYMKKGKYTEAELGLAGISRNVRLYRMQKNALPPSSSLMPATGACATKTKKTPLTKQAAWQANPGWKALDFHIAEPGYFQYIWLNLGTNSGQAYALGDTDCDNTFGYLYMVMTVSKAGSLTQAKFDFMAAD
jgi:prepilin-type N-terminal cleavage/methylation domain-containing protein